MSATQTVGSPIGDLDDDEIARCAAIIGVDPELVKQHGLIRATGLDPECSWVPAGRERDDYDGSVRSGVEISTSMADALMKSGWLAGRDG